MANFLTSLFRRSPPAPAAWLEINDLRAHLDNGDPVVLIDVRQNEEFTAPPEHLPDAINIPLSELPGRIDEIVSYARPIVLVCKTDRRSAKAAEALLAAGLRDIAVLRGGTDGWHQQGLPLDL